MHASRPLGQPALTRFAALASVAAVVLPAVAAQAGDLLGLYVGGAVADAQIRTDGAYISGVEFKENHSAYKFMAGIRPISPVGVEVAYIDFGHPSGTLVGAPADVKMKGSAAFGVWYLPVPVVDLYLKAGLARLQSTVTARDPVVTVLCPTTGCTPHFFQLTRTNTSFAAGAGAQLKLGSWAVRGEYERFNAAGGHPGLVSLGLTWTFL